MSKPITLINDTDRQLADNVRATRVAADQRIESWELELYAAGSEDPIAADAYSMRAPSKRDDVLDLISHVLASVGLQASPSPVSSAQRNSDMLIFYIRKE